MKYNKATQGSIHIVNGSNAGPNDGPSNVLGRPLFNHRYLQGSDGWRYAASVDTETTGICRRSRIVQISALRFRYRENPDTSITRPQVEFSKNFRFSSIIKPPPRTPFTPAAVQKTGINWHAAMKGISFIDALPGILQAIGPLPIVAHNESFDRRMLHRELVDIECNHADGFIGEYKEKHPGLMADKWNCTLLMSRRKFGKIAEDGSALSMKLEDLSNRLELVPTGAFHNSETDSEVCGHLYAALDLNKIHIPEKILCIESEPTFSM